MHQDRKFQYNISPLVSDELPPFNSKYNYPRNPRDANLGNMSPIKPRTPVNPSFQQRPRVNLEKRNDQSQYYGSLRNEQVGEQRPRLSKYNQENVSFQNTRKNINLDEDELISKVLNREDRNKSYLQNKRPSRPRHEQPLSQTVSNIPTDTIKMRHSYNEPQKKIYPQHEPKPNPNPPFKEISQKQLFEKIGRINRLNDEINTRLQKMLKKIDSYE